MRTLAQEVRAVRRKASARSKKPSQSLGGRADPSPVGSVLLLQSAIGNQAVQRHLARSPERQVDRGPGHLAATLFTRISDPVIQRAMKFEFQSTTNRVWRHKGKKRKLLPRKFGPTKKPKNSRFLHKGSKGKPAKGSKEGTAIELQSEARGFVEFETPSWHRKWCDVKERVQEAVDMVDAINAAPVVSTDAGVDTVEFPFDVGHLKRSKTFPKGLRKGENLEVEIADRTWPAKIQASEAFELTQFQSYMEEHLSAPRAAKISGDAKAILDEANAKAKIPDADLVRLLSFLQIIIEHINSAQEFNTDKKHLAKESILLMSRTNFSSIYHDLLTPRERKLFRSMVRKGLILKGLGVDRKTRVFPLGFVGRKSPGPTIHKWLVSIHTRRRDLLSSLGGDNRAMGRFNVEKKEGKKDTNLVKFEARGGAGHILERPAKDRVDVHGVVTLGGWVAFCEEVFKAAHDKRARTGGTELEYPGTC
jgi:hypothetical protein